MPKLLKTLPACAAFLLTLCAVAGSGWATPSDGQTRGAAPQGGLQLAHNGGEAAAPQAEHPERFVRIAAFDWSKAAPQASIRANLTIESALPFALQKVEIACTQFARTGIEIDRSQRTIDRVVPAHGRLRVDALDIGPVHPQASSSGCRVVGVTPA
jgi:hypothetical protein